MLAVKNHDRCRRLLISKEAEVDRRGRMVPKAPASDTQMRTETMERVTSVDDGDPGQYVTDTRGNPTTQTI